MWGPGVQLGMCCLRCLLNVEMEMSRLWLDMQVWSWREGLWIVGRVQEGTNPLKNTQSGWYLQQLSINGVGSLHGYLVHQLTVPYSTELPSSVTPLIFPYLRLLLSNLSESHFQVMTCLTMKWVPSYRSQLLLSPQSWSSPVSVQLGLSTLARGPATGWDLVLVLRMGCWENQNSPGRGLATTPKVPPYSTMDEILPLVTEGKRLSIPHGPGR